MNEPRRKCWIGKDYRFTYCKFANNNNNIVFFSWGVLIFERDSSSRLSFVKEMGPLDEKDEENNSRPRRRSSSHSPSPQEAALLSQYETTIVTQLRAVSKPNLNREEALESGRYIFIEIANFPTFFITLFPRNRKQFRVVRIYCKIPSCPHGCEFA